MAAMFCLGLFSVTAQVMFMREMLVVFFGNELCIGTILGCWLAGISLGAFSARGLLRFVSGRRWIPWLLGSLLILLALMLPAQVYAIRTIRILLRVSPGEYASFAEIFSSALVVFLPTCYSIGLFFPLACDVLAASSRRVHKSSKNGEDAGHAPGAAAVSLVYTLEALGSMTGGIVLTYLLLPWLSPLRIILLGSVGGLTGASVVMGPFGNGGGSRVPGSWIACAALSASAACILLVVVARPAWLASVELEFIRTRWRAFGVVGSGEREGRPSVRLLRSSNTIYQNLAVTESEGQYALYGNGQVMFIFPDPIGDEHRVHFIMAQKPEARRVLLLGGNPVGDLPELLKYPVHRIVYVDLDRGVGEMVRSVAPGKYDAALKDPRVEYIAQDGPRFVRMCTERFDAVIINAPEPTTAAANRFYTREFYENIRRILDAEAFMYTAVTSSARLQTEAADLGASVYQTLKDVFPVVLVTAEIRNRFFAGGPEAGLTLNRQLLTDRSRGARLDTQFFNPVYFLGADEIAPEKTAYVAGRFTSSRVPLNTDLKPVTYFYHFLLWSRFSGSRVAALLHSAKSLDYRTLVRGLIVLGMLCTGAGLLLRVARPNRGTRGHCWSRCMTGSLMATTGFCGMALEIVLIFVFQSLYGYVYTRMGLIVAMFMFGLVVGAPSGRLMAGGSRRRAWSAMAGIELLLLLVALALPKLVGLASVPGIEGEQVLWCEPVIYAAVAIVGWAVGAEFPLGNRLYCDAGGTVGAAAAVTDASDHAGAAIGCLATGVVLVPVFGIGASCLVLAAMKCAGLLLLASAFVAMRGRGEATGDEGNGRFSEV